MLLNKISVDTVMIRFAGVKGEFATLKLFFEEIREKAIFHCDRSNFSS